MRTRDVRVVFGRTTSSRRNDAVELARLLPGFKSWSEGRYSLFSVRVPIDFDHRETFLQLQALIGIVSNWQTTHITLGGRAVREPWKTFVAIEQLICCYESRSKATDGEAYCSGRNTALADCQFFGCRHTRGVTLSDRYDESTPWWAFGRVTEDRKTFVVDRRAILDTIKRANRSTLPTWCPAFRWDRIRDDVHSLPETIDVSRKGAFRLKYSELDARRVIGIEPTAQRGLFKIEIGLGGEEGEPEQATRQIPTVSFSDVAGQATALAQVRDVVSLPLVRSEYFRAMGLTPHRGILMYGPPGNGKTLIAKAVANECQAHLELINGPEILSKWLGQSEENLRRVFHRARQLAPSIVLIDEIDAIAPRRDLMSEHHDVRLISQLLVMLDGIEERGQVVVIGTTNRLDAVDPAIRRPGRFDYLIEIRPPDAEGRREVLQVHLRRLRVSAKVDLESLASLTIGWSGADLEALCREAALTRIKAAIAEGVQPEEAVIVQADLERAVAAVREERARGDLSEPR